MNPNSSQQMYQVKKINKDGVLHIYLKVVTNTIVMYCPRSLNRDSIFVRLKHFCEF